MKKIIAVLMVFIFAFLFASCKKELKPYENSEEERNIFGMKKKSTTTTKDVSVYRAFTSAETLEQALNDGEDVVGASATVTINEVTYSEEEGGLNYYKAGEHLNFVSAVKYIIAEGSTVTVTITQTDLVDETYWVINFDVPE